MQGGGYSPYGGQQSQQSQQYGQQSQQYGQAGANQPPATNGIQRPGAQPSAQPSAAAPAPVTSSQRAPAGIQSSDSASPAGGQRPLSQRAKGLEQKAKELEALCAERDQTIAMLRAQILEVRGGEGATERSRRTRSASPQASGRRSGSTSPRGRGGRAPDDAPTGPVVPYRVVAPTDDIDVRLEEFYNKTNSAVPFKRINRGFYKFGGTLVELDIVNLKLVARTEDGWNRGKFSAIERFLQVYEEIERANLETEE